MGAREVAMANPHDLVLPGLRRDLETGRQRVALDEQRVVAGGLERVRQVAVEAPRVVKDRRELAVHHAIGAHDVPTERLSDRLVAEADPEDRNLAGEPADDVYRDPGLVGRAGSGRAVSYTHFRAHVTPEQLV